MLVEFWLSKEVMPEDATIAVRAINGVIPLEIGNLSQKVMHQAILPFDINH